MGKALIGFIGFGEAPHCICKGLLSGAAPRIIAYDIMAEDAKLGPRIRQRAQDTNVTLVGSLQELLENAAYIFNFTSAKYALSIAGQAAEFLKPGVNYADMNSASPMVKQEIGRIVGKNGALFTDAAVMELVPPNGPRVPIAASGTGARAFTDTLNSIGMNATYISDTAGSSSSMKMFRSIFMKGFTCLLLESLSASYQMGVGKEVMDSIAGTLTKNTPDQLANLLINRTAVGAERRVSEMKDVVSTLEAMGLPAFTSKATVERLQWVCDLGLKEYFDGQAPKQYEEVFQAILEKTKQ